MCADLTRSRMLTFTESRVNSDSALRRGEHIMKSAIELIEQYRNDHAGKSSYIDRQLDIAEQAIKDSTRNKSRGDNDFALVNLFIGRNLMCKLLEAIPVPDSIRTSLVNIYSAVDREICDIQGI